MCVCRDQELGAFGNHLLEFRQAQLQISSNVYWYFYFSFRQSGVGICWQFRSITTASIDCNFYLQQLSMCSFHDQELGAFGTHPLGLRQAQAIDFY